MRSKTSEHGGTSSSRQDQNLATTGGMAREATTFYKKLATDVAVKRNLQYSTVISWLRCCLSFVLLRSAITCVFCTLFWSALEAGVGRLHTYILV